MLFIMQTYSSFYNGGGLISEFSLMLIWGDDFLVPRIQNSLSLRSLSPSLPPPREISAERGLYDVQKYFPSPSGIKTPNIQNFN